MVGVGASAGRLAFDAIVQRDAPDANYGRSFAGFETRFQLLWVIGGFLPVIVPIPAQLGFVVVAITAGFGALRLCRSWRTGVSSPPLPITASPTTSPTTSF